MLYYYVRDDMYNSGWIVNRCQLNPRSNYWEVIKRILKYLHITRNYKQACIHVLIWCVHLKWWNYQMMGREKNAAFLTLSWRPSIWPPWMWMKRLYDFVTPSTIWMLSWTLNNNRHSTVITMVHLQIPKNN